MPKKGENEEKPEGENNPPETPPVAADLKPLETRVQYCEKVLKVILQSVSHLEKETGTSIMPEGEFFGVKF